MMRRNRLDYCVTKLFQVIIKELCIHHDIISHAKTSKIIYLSIKKAAQSRETTQRWLSAATGEIEVPGEVRNPSSVGATTRTTFLNKFVTMKLIIALLATAVSCMARAPPSEFTKAANNALRKRLDFNDVSDFTDANRGFLGRMAEKALAPFWDLGDYAFLDANSTKDDAPDTVNPSLWRVSKLNMADGLFEVVPGVYQVRGYDLSVMTIIKGDEGYIIVDPLVSKEVTQPIWEQLVIPKLGNKPITNVIYTHSHGDHFGGIRGLITYVHLCKRADVFLATRMFPVEE
jgi:hypothetical protein